MDVLHAWDAGQIGHAWKIAVVGFALVSLGVLLGEFAVETIWAVIAIVNQYATYTCSINGRLGWNQ